jgi:hypothetical protein
VRHRLDLLLLLFSSIMILALPLHVGVKVGLIVFSWLFIPALPLLSLAFSDYTATHTCDREMVLTVLIPGGWHTVPEIKKLVERALGLRFPKHVSISKVMQVVYSLKDENMLVSRPRHPPEPAIFFEGVAWEYGIK